MTDIAAQLAALRDAYRSGHLEVSYEGKTVKWRSLDEMRQAIADLEA